jgi:hypothetical protein
MSQSPCPTPPENETIDNWPAGSKMVVRPVPVSASKTVASLLREFHVNVDVPAVSVRDRIRPNESYPNYD